MVPVVEALAREGVIVSIDTRKATVMEAALAAGARIINDVSGLTHDPRSIEVAARSSAFVVLMHMAGEPATMNDAPRYEQCALEVFDWLATRVAACEAAGIDRERIMVDPGLCFAKHEPHNLDVLRHLTLYHGLGCPVLLGASRKGWTARLDREWPARERLRRLAGGGAVGAGSWRAGAAGPRRGGAPATAGGMARAERAGGGMTAVLWVERMAGIEVGKSGSGA